MPRYEWIGDGTFNDNANDREVEPGEQVELDEHVGEPNTELVRVEEDEEDDDVEEEFESEPVSEESAADEDEESEAAEELEAVEPPFDPAEYTVGELREELEAEAYSDVELDALAEAEEAADNRATALEAVAEARE